jgi:signal transduction histidine kinase
MILAILSVCIGTIGWFIGFFFGNTLLLILFAPILSLAIVIYYVYYLVKKLDYLAYIMEGTNRIKNGDIHYKLDIIGDDNFSSLAEDINNIREGLDKAIYNQVKSERMKSELITNVSHDLKTPLTSIINYIELIKKEENIEPEYIKDYINVLDSKSKRLKVLIEDLFEASKASSGNLELNMEKIDITQLLRQAIGEMEEKLSSANLDLKLRVPEEKTYINADGKKLYRVLENLLSNISKYSLDNTRVYIDIVQDNGKVKLTMKNISSYELNFDPDEIMERFKRADESRNTEGSGLGLAIARDLVNAQGGRFEIDIDGDLFKAIIEFDLID